VTLLIIVVDDIFSKDNWENYAASGQWAATFAACTPLPPLPGTLWLSRPL